MIFGDENKFALSYKPGPESNTQSQVLVYCHLILNNNLIGFPDEVDMLGTCIGDLERLRKKVLICKEKKNDHLFNQLNDREVIELIYKSNQLKSEFNREYAYLHAPPTNQIWHDYTVQLAESTDQDLIVFFNQNGKIKFLWMNATDFENGKKELQSVYIEFESVLFAMDSFLVYLKTEYPDFF